MLYTHKGPMFYSRKEQSFNQGVKYSCCFEGFLQKLFTFITLFILHDSKQNFKLIC